MLLLMKIMLLRLFDTDAVSTQGIICIVTVEKHIAIIKFYLRSYLK